MLIAVRVFVATLLILSSPVRSFVEPAFADTAKGSFRVGLLDPRSGPLAREGRDADEGFRYFLATHGDRLGGFRVEIRSGDEGETVADTLAVARQLLDIDDVDAIVGLASSDAARGIWALLDDRKKPVIVTGAADDDLTQTPPHRTFFRVASGASQVTMPLGDFVCRHLGRRTAAIVAVDREFGWDSAGGFARAYTDAGCRIVQEQYAAEGSDWNAVAAKIDRDASVVFASPGTDSVAFLAAFAGTGPKTQVVGDGTLTADQVLGDERESAAGIITTLPYAATLQRPQSTAFRVGYETLSSRPVTEFVENGYVAAAALSEALDHLPAGAVKSEDLAAALRDARIDAPRGPVAFDAFGGAIENVYVRRVREAGGRFRNDVIASYPAVSQFWRYDPQKYLEFAPYAKLKGTWARP
jgi:branched-chain amino acid transport system substrate-binding protein